MGAPVAEVPTGTLRRVSGTAGDPGSIEAGLATLVPPVDDDELLAQALAADPHAPPSEDALSFDELTERDDFELLPEWYMPRPAAGPRLLEGWRRRVVVAVVGSIVLVNAAGFCVIYGRITIG